MPRPVAKPKPEPEPMDIHEMTAEQEIVAEPEMAEEHEEEAEQEPEAEDQPDEEEYEEMITLSAADVYALQDTLEDIRFQILNIQRDARQDRLELQAMLQDILSRLPPALGTSPPAPGFSSAPTQ
jgi:molecular chaperone GrpE (heat shock protein)